MRWVGLALIVAAACGGPTITNTDAKGGDGKSLDGGPDPNDGAHSGARLKITYWTFPDGTRTWNGFYDAQRKENCSIDAWADGSYYCTPSSNSSIAWQAGCTTKIAMFYRDPGCPEPAAPYILDYDYTCTFQYTHLYARGAKLTTSTYYEKNDDGSCGGPYTTSNYDFYALGAEIASSSLVALTMSAPTGSGNLTERFVTSSDGLVFPWSAHDATLGADCYASTYDPTGATAVCVPDAAYAGYAHDAQCKVPEVALQKTCTAPQYAEYFSTSECPADPPAYYPVGSVVASSPLYYPNGAQCVATTASTSDNYYSTGAKLTLSSLSRAPDDLPSHRIQLIHETTPDGLRLRDYSLYDQTLGAECSLTSTLDGTTRCLTFGTDIETYYKDAMCMTTVDLARVSTGPTTCGAPTPPKYGYKFITPAAGSCGYSYEIHPLGGAYTAAVYQNNGTCAAYSPSANQVALYSVGAAMDVTTFALATAVTDQ